MLKPTLSTSGTYVCVSMEIVVVEVNATRRDRFLAMASRHLNEAGFVVYRGIFSSEECRALRLLSDELSTRAACILENAAAAGESLAEWSRNNIQDLIVVPEQSNPLAVCRYEFMMGYCGAFRSFVESRVQPIVAAAAGARVVCFKDKTNEKAPGSGGFKPHQDAVAYQSFGANYFITAMLCIDAANVSNGCLHVATNVREVCATMPETVLRHADGHVLFRYVDSDPCYGDLDSAVCSQLNWCALECDTSDLVLFDSFVPHYSETNLSHSSRRAIFVTYNLASTGSLYQRYYAEKRSNYHDRKFHVSTPTNRLA